MKTLLITNKIVQSQTFICSRLHKSWLFEIKNDARKENHDFLKESDDFKIIKSQEEYKNFDFKRFAADHIFVVPELMWENDGVNEGYSVARELITHTFKSEFIQLVFLSVLERSTLAKSVDTRNRSFVEAFPHVCLVDENPDIKFEYYSNIHYNLIKNLAISDHGRIQKLGHEMNSFNANILNDKISIEINKAQLVKELEELSLFQAWVPAETNILDFISKVNLATKKSDLEKIGKVISDVISDVTLKLPKDNFDKTPEIKQKKEFKILVVEDEATYREYFLKVLSAFYNGVYPDEKNEYLSEKGKKSFNIRDAKEIIAANAKKYQIFLLDLLYKDQDGNWLNFNGLDLFKLIIEKNRYAVVRIITSLPRGIVAKVVETIYNNTSKPNTDQVFTKKYGYEALKDSIIDSIDNMNEECEQNEQIKKLLWPIPKNGIFGAPGISELMMSLLTDRKSEYEEHKDQALDFFDLFTKNQLTKETRNWNKGILGKGTSFSKPTEKFFLEKFTNIMVYRLISIEFSLESDMQRINFDTFLEKIEICSKISGINNEFFYSLGFSRGDEGKNDDYYHMSFSSFLPHESLFIEQKTREKYENSFVKDYPNLQDWVKTNLIAFDYLKLIWNNLRLNFDWYKRNFDIETLTIAQLQAFFAHIYMLSTDTLFIKVFKKLGNAIINKYVESELKNFPELKYQIELVLNKI